VSVRLSLSMEEQETCCERRVGVYVVKGQLTLQKLWFYIQPTMRTMEIMASVATSINRVSTFHCFSMLQLLESLLLMNLPPCSVLVIE